METKLKQLYETPSTIVSELKTKGVICSSSLSITWLTGELNPAETDWGRTSYGDAVTNTWE